MAEMPQKMFGLDEVGAPALLLCSLLWRWVPVRAKFETAGPHFVYRPIEDLASDRNVGTRAIQEHLRQLRDAGLISAAVQGSRRGYLLHTPSDLRDERQPEDARPARKIDSASAGDRRSLEQGSPIDRVRDRSSADDQTIGDRRSFEQRSPIDRVVVKEEPEEPEYPETAAGRQTAGSVDQVARELLREISIALCSIPGRMPLRPLTPDRRTVALLVELLAVGEDLTQRRAYVLEVVTTYAAICRNDEAQAGWWGPEMFGQLARRGTMAPWAAVETTVGKHRRREAVAQASEQAAAERRASEQAALAERAALASRHVTSEAQVAELAASGGSFGARLAEDLRRQGEARERAQAEAAEQRARDAAKAQRDLASPLQAERAGWLSELLAAPHELTESDLDDLTSNELEQARAAVSRAVAVAKLEENEDRVRLLLQVRLLVDRRRAGVPPVNG